MSLNVFKIAGNEDFFNVLSTPSRQANWMVIYELYNEVMEIHERRISRSSARRLIERITDIYNKDSQNKIAKEASNYISAFIDSGWLIQRYDGEEGDDFLYFTPYAMSFIRSIEYNENPAEIVQVDDYLKRIHFIVKDMLTKNINSDAYKYPYRCGIVKINYLMSDCFYSLRTIEHQTTEDIKNILDIQDLQTLIDKLQAYVDDLSSGYLHDVYDSFNLTGMLRKNIIELIDSILYKEDFRELVIKDMRERYKNVDDYKDDEELSNMLTDMVNSLEIKINVTYPSYKERIDKTIQNMIEKSIHKMNMLSESNASHLTTLNRVIDKMSYIAETNNESVYAENERLTQLFEESVKLAKLKTIDAKSLFKKREYTIKEEIQPIEIVEIDDDFDFGDFEIDRYSIEDANKYVRWALRDDKEVRASQFRLHEGTIAALQTIVSQSDDMMADYEIEFLGEKVIKDGYEFENFKIIKK